MEVLTRVRAQLAGCMDTAVWTLPDGDLVACVDAVAVVQAQLAAVQAHLVREVEGRGVPAAQGASSTGVWLRQRLRVSPAAAGRLVALARELDRRPALDEALGAGSVNPEQVAVIAAGVRELAADAAVEPVVVGKAETVLIDYASRFDPVGLRALSGRVLAHVAPDVAERVDAAVLARQEVRAAQTRALHLTSAGDGRVRVTGWLDTEAAAVVTAALDPLCAPHRRPGRPDTLAGRPDTQPGRPGTLAGQPDTQPGHPDNPAGQSGMLAGQSGMLAGQSGMLAGQSGMLAGQPGMLAGQVHVGVGERDERTPGQRRADASGGGVPARAGRRRAAGQRRRPPPTRGHRRRSTCYATN